jgi:acetyl esterase/lipase
MSDPAERPQTAFPPVPIDPECAAALASAGTTAAMTITPEQIPALRAALSEQSPTIEQLRRGGAFRIEEHAAPGPLGPVPLLLLRPAHAVATTAALYFIHGGGMVMGTNRSGLDPILDIAASLGLVVVSVDYRLAPEHPDPAPVEDCYAGLLWTADAADSIGIDSSRLVVGGPSAGGGLAAGVALMARDNGGPALAGQLLMCPMLDDRDQSYSTVQMEGHGVWDRTANRTGWSALLGSRRAGSNVSPYAAPARCADCSRLPATYLDVGSAETFREETVAYAAAIWRAGGTAELHVWQGAFHRHDLFARETRLGRSTWTVREDWLRRLFNT